MNFTGDDDESLDDDIDEGFVVDCQQIYSIRTEKDCQRACQPFPYNILYTTRETENATGIIRISYGGFRCQCLQGDPPIDCDYKYKFPTCNDVGIISCNPLLSSMQPIIPPAADATDDESSIKDNVPTNITTNITKPYDIRSCGEYCGMLGFEQDPFDNNSNENDHLCTINEVMTPNWISCACGVDIDLDGGKTITITDGFYVCGDPGFEVGLNFAKRSGSGVSAFRRATIAAYCYTIGIVAFAVSF
jgi:hypothetical protein